MRRSCLFLSLLASVSCGEEDNVAELIVDLRTDLIPGTEFVGVQAELLAEVPGFRVGGAPQQMLGYTTTESLLPTRIAEFADLPLGTHLLRVRLLRSNGDLALERIAVVEVRGTTAVTLVMTRSCDGVSCPGSGDNPSDIACLGGRCVDPACTPETPEFCPEAACGSPSDCPAVDPCAQRRCDFGVCLPAVLQFGCAADRYCQPDIGCTPTHCVVTRGANGSPCSNNTECDGTCIAGRCSDAMGFGGACDTGDDSDCMTGLTCPAAVCLGDTGTLCIGDVDCAGICDGVRCAPPNQSNGARCDDNSDCENTCIGGVCTPFAFNGGICDFDDSQDCNDGLTCTGTRCTTMLIGPPRRFDPFPSSKIPGEATTREGTILDLNGDGILDALVAQSSPSGRQVVSMLGVGDGTFLSPADTVAIGVFVDGLVTNDFDGDGEQDFAVAGPGSSRVEVRFGAGDGRFVLGQTVTITAPGRAIATGDINEDGNADIAVVTSAGLETLLGNGTGAFSSGPSLFVEATQIVFGDVNGDGHLDGVVNRIRPRQVETLLGAGDGTFSVGPTAPEPLTNPVSLKLADLDQDGNLDLLASVSQGVSIRLGNGDGSFGGSVIQPDGHLGSPIDIEVADLNGDSIPDLAAAVEVGAFVAYALGIGDGSFTATATVSVSRGPASLDVVDVNRDGALDFVTPSIGADALSVVPGRGDGTFRSGFALTGRIDYVGVAAGDLDKDGYPDLVSATLDDNLSIRRGLGDERLEAAVDFPIPTVRPTDVALADLDGDDNLDAVVADGPSDMLVVLLGNGDLTFSTLPTVTVGENPVAVVLGDLNGDGDLDAVTANQTMNELSILLGAGDGSLNLDRTVSSQGTGLKLLAIGNLNDDRNPDLLALHEGSSDVVSFLGAGDGSFTFVATTAFPSEPMALAMADVNGNGRSDALISTLNDTVNVLLSAGDGTFTAANAVTGAPGPSAIFAGDIDGDLDIDFVTGNSFAVYLGDGTGRFTQEMLFSVGGDDLVLTDLNRDGRLDIVGSVLGGGRLVTLIQRP